MDRETLYKFFEGAASYEEEVRIRQWMEHSPENRREFLKERKIFDSMLLLGDEKTIEEKMRHKSWSLSSLGTELIKIAAAVAVTLGLAYYINLFQIKMELCRCNPFMFLPDNG